MNGLLCVTGPRCIWMSLEWASYATALWQSCGGRESPCSPVWSVIQQARFARYCNSKHGNTIAQHESRTAEDTRELQINKSTKSCMTTHQCGAPASGKFAQLHTVEAYYLTPLYQAAARVIRSNNAKQALCLNRIILSHAIAFFSWILLFFCMLLLTLISRPDIFYC